MTNSFIYPEDLQPVRLDKALARQLGLGLRRCRTLIDDGIRNSGRFAAIYRQLLAELPATP